MHFDVILFPRELRHIPLRLYVQYRRREEFLYLCNYRYDLDEKMSFPTRGYASLISNA